MNKVFLNAVRLNAVVINSVGSFIKKVVRYFEDGNIPDTHTQMYDADGVAFYASDAKFNVKKEQ